LNPAFLYIYFFIVQKKKMQPQKPPEVVILVPPAKLAKMGLDAAEVARVEACAGVVIRTADPALLDTEAGRAAVADLLAGAAGCVHKMSYDLALVCDAAHGVGPAAAAAVAAAAAARVDAFTALVQHASAARQPPRVPLRVTDPLPSVQSVLSRAQMYTMLAQACPTLRQPPFCVVAEGNIPPPDALASRLDGLDTTLGGVDSIFPPAVTKSDLAAGTAGSHAMTVTRSLDEWIAAHPPTAASTAEASTVQSTSPPAGTPPPPPPPRLLVVQAFVPHGCVVHKIYVAGESTSVSVRTSLAGDEVGVLDSQRLPCASASAPAVAASGCVPDAAQAARLDAATVASIVDEVRRATGLSLFGIDVVVDERTGHPAVVDVNFFPGYKGVADCWVHIVRAACP
jgi:hypothetical protein